MDWLKAATENLKDQMEFCINELGMDIDQATDKVKQTSTAGSKTWRVVLEQLNQK